MAIFRAATPGTLLCLGGTALLLLASINAPIIKSLYFLRANISASSNSVDFSNGGLLIDIGTFGYCVEGDACYGPTLGYNLNSNALLGIYSSYVQLPENLIKWLTYVLIVHPIAAGLGAIASLLGIIGHFRELSVVLTLSATWFSGLASTVSLIAFIFDMVVFSIVKSRIGSAGSQANDVNVSAGASYGSSIWITLAGFLCFAISGCCFNFGRRVARERRADKVAQAWLPKRGDAYAEREREAAIEAEERRKLNFSNTSDRNNRSSRAERGLPSFAEDVNTSNNDMTETLPLRSYDYGADQYHNYFQSHTQYPSQSSYSGRQEVAGVGYGYGRRNNTSNNISTSESAGAAGIGAGAVMPSSQPASAVPSRLRPMNNSRSAQPEPFSGSMSDNRGPAMSATGAQRGPLYSTHNADRPSALTPGRNNTREASASEELPPPVSSGPPLAHPQIAHLPNLSSYNPESSQATASRNVLATSPVDRELDTSPLQAPQAQAQEHDQPQSASRLRWQVPGYQQHGYGQTDNATLTDRPPPTYYTNDADPYEGYYDPYVPRQEAEQDDYLRDSEMQGNGGNVAGPLRQSYQEEYPTSHTAQHYQRYGNQSYNDSRW